MVKVLIELDDVTAKRLEEVAPSRSRRRSAFIRMAIRRALWNLEEKSTAEAYARYPDDEEPHFDPEVWETSSAGRKQKREK